LPTLRVIAFGDIPANTITPAGNMTMEAEQLNALTKHLQDLQVRNLELRRYL
jgi:hypothetical protein